MTAAAFENVGKIYPPGWSGRRGTRAVADVNLQVPAGQVFGLLGPNRAGKTTLVKLLLALGRPTEGTVRRLGRPASDLSTLARVGYMHENQHFPRYLTARELLRFYAALTLMKPETIPARADELLKLVGLADRAAEPISRFSKGMVQRLGLAQALLNDPDLLVLDEPTEGLDLVGRRLLRDVVADVRRRGRTVLLVSHVLAEVERLCDRVAVVVNGRLVHAGPTAALLQGPAPGEARALEQALQELYEKPVP